MAVPNEGRGRRDSNFLTLRPILNWPPKYRRTQANPTPQPGAEHDNTTGTCKISVLQGQELEPSNMCLCLRR